MSCTHCNAQRVVGKCRSCYSLVCSVTCLELHTANVGCANHMRTSYERAMTNTLPTLETELKEDDMYMVFKYLRAGESLGEERHPNATQFFMVLEGSGVATINGKADDIGVNSMFYVPHNALHDVRASADGPLRMITIYSKREHETMK